MQLRLPISKPQVNMYVFSSKVVLLRVWKKKSVKFVRDIKLNTSNRNLGIKYIMHARDDGR